MTTYSTLPAPTLTPGIPLSVLAVRPRHRAPPPVTIGTLATPPTGIPTKSVLPAPMIPRIPTTTITGLSSHRETFVTPSRRLIPVPQIRTSSSQLTSTSIDSSDNRGQLIPFVSGPYQEVKITAPSGAEFPDIALFQPQVDDDDPVIVIPQVQPESPRGQQAQSLVREYLPFEEPSENVIYMEPTSVPSSTFAGMTLPEIPTIFYPSPEINFPDPSTLQSMYEYEHSTPSTNVEGVEDAEDVEDVEDVDDVAESVYTYVNTPDLVSISLPRPVGISRMTTLPVPPRSPLTMLTVPLIPSPPR